MLSLLCLTTAVALPSRSCVAPPRPLPRRAAFALGAQTLTAALLARPGVARAEGQDPQDFARVGKGLKEVQFLLDNWSKETTKMIAATTTFFERVSFVDGRFKRRRKRDFDWS